ncbi:hypothetical protein C0J52_22366 [Blattella germanica]|nr:hypothetical protein C0J52_22366 [Blattella germanica]
MLLKEETKESFPRSLMSRLMVPDMVRNSVGSAPSSPNLTRGESMSRLGRSKTVARPDPKKEKLKGLQMNVCHDCKTMVIQIIKSSRTNRTNAIRNLTLNLSPVY